MNLLVSDYDQTLALDDFTIWLNNKKIKQFRENGNLFILSTGRAYESIKEEIGKYNIKYDYLSCADGTSLYDSSDKIINCSKLNYEDLKKSNYLKLKYGKDIYINDLISDNSKLPEVRIIIVKKLIYKNDIEEITKYFDKYLVNSEYGVRRNTIFLRPKGINKSYSVEYFSKMLNLGKNNIFTIGDHDNDYEMIRNYNGFTMLWGTKLAKEYALGKYLIMSSLIDDIENKNDKFVKKLRFK